MTAMIPKDGIDPEQGIALSLAQQRAKAVDNVRYDLFFTIPATSFRPILGRAIIRLFLRDASSPLILDFAPGEDFVTAVFLASRHCAARFVNGHIVLPL